MTKLSEFIKKHHHVRCTCVVAAAGSSQRMGEDKLNIKIGPAPVLVHTLRALQACDAIDEIVIVTREDKIEETAVLCRNYGILKVSSVLIGGATRTESALIGCCAADEKSKIICIHDGARPFVTDEIIEEAIHNAVLYRAAAPCVPVKDTIKVGENGVITETLERTSLAAMQTPQAFDADIIKGALTMAYQSETVYTDDCAAVEALGVKVHLTKGSEENIKITTPLDVELAKAIYAKRKKEQQ
ncbi:MAG: 2-C-methyl-D-erythritol 4-phosphate cytidylyltransferase [Oscillospiraceae bacterium]|nr:2-C-methyl-D-erythritol 4-phosphate cytidylyltransferase [Oscillospiraceae bacterium]MBR5260868.1 2-C-methyl-D-erythritol 4-phosphate cytidylyltransferase [Oscillospiraceae bacterium]